MSIQINGTNGLTFNDGSSQQTAWVPGMRNRIINGAMMIDQRNAGASVTPASGSYTLDRWVYAGTAASKFTFQQNAGSITPPAGFANYLRITSTSAYSVSSTDYFSIAQNIEGYNCSDLAWGTANAQPVTLSFWVRSSLTGTFGGALYNQSGSVSYPFAYTISAANTWEYKTVGIAGPTSGSIPSSVSNGLGFTVSFALGVGSTLSGSAGSWGSTLYRSVTGATSVVGTNGATFYITGVQLEKGSTATSFDYRPYGTELALCQRYYQYIGGAGSQSFGTAVNWDGAAGYGGLVFPVPMRTAPTYALQGTASSVQLFFNGQTTKQLTILNAQSISSNGCEIIGQWSGALTVTTYPSAWFRLEASNFLTFSAEL